MPTPHDTGIGGNPRDGTDWGQHAGLGACGAFFGPRTGGQWLLWHRQAEEDPPVKAQCQVCFADTYCAAGAEHACPSNSFAPVGSKALADCKCSAGYYDADGSAEDDSLTCTACPAGRYAPATGLETLGAPRVDASNCTRCAFGKYSPATAQYEALTCVDCAEGKYGRPAGEFLNGTFIPDAPGEAGDLVDGLTAERDCLPCPDGGVSGAGSHRPYHCSCSAGSYDADGNGTNPTVYCTGCPPGFFGASPGLTDPAQCTACPAARTSAVRGSWSCHPNSGAVYCQPGTYSAGGRAVAGAAVGSFAAAEAMVEPGQCTSCPASAPRRGWDLVLREPGSAHKDVFRPHVGPPAPGSDSFYPAGYVSSPLQCTHPVETPGYADCFAATKTLTKSPAIAAVCLFHIVLQTISVNALCFVQMLSNKRLNWPITTRAHAHGRSRPRGGRAATSGPAS